MITEIVGAPATTMTHRFFGCWETSGRLTAGPELERSSGQRIARPKGRLVSWSLPLVVQVLLVAKVKGLRTRRPKGGETETTSGSSRRSPVSGHYKPAHSSVLPLVYSAGYRPGDLPSVGRLSMCFKIMTGRPKGATHTHKRRDLPREGLCRT